MSSYEFSPFSAAMCEQKVGMFFLVMTMFFFPQKILALPFVWCSFKHFQKKSGPCQRALGFKDGKRKTTSQGNEGQECDLEEACSPQPRDLEGQEPAHVLRRKDGELW